MGEEVRRHSEVLNLAHKVTFHKTTSVYIVETVKRQNTRNTRRKTLFKKTHELPVISVYRECARKVLNKEFILHNQYFIKHVVITNKICSYYQEFSVKHVILLCAGT